jgi:endonuclease/exonuclease/phosphatase family metal-dependent hydrolase
MGFGATFLDRYSPSDIRIMTYNIYQDHNFPDTSSINAAKFARIISAVNPDILNIQEVYTHSAAQGVALMNSIAPRPNGQSWYGWRGSDNVILSKYPLSMQGTQPSPSPAWSMAMALVDLPSATYDRDFYIMNNHYKCCAGFDALRQQTSDSIVNWMRQGRTDGGSFDLPGWTPIITLGDLNIVEGVQPKQTLIDGNIIFESTYGTDSPPDWDGSFARDVAPLHNGVGPANYTWRDDSSSFAPGVLDYIFFTDSAADLANRFVLNTVTMSAADRAATGLQVNDVVLDPSQGDYDHLPVVADFRLAPWSRIADFDLDGNLDAGDIDLLQTIFRSGTNQLRYDLNGDANLSTHDMQAWLFDILGTIPGDANLDLVVDGQDFNVWNASKFQTGRLWTQGDFNFDGVVDGVDFNIWNSNKFTSAVTIVPEPVMGIWFVCIGFCGLFDPRRLRTKWC